MTAEVKTTAERTRRSAKASFTRAEKPVYDYIHSNRDCAEIEDLLKVCATKFDLVQCAHDKYCGYLDDDEFDNEEVWITEICDRFHRLKCAVNDYNKKQSTTNASTSQQRSTTNSNFRLQTQTSPLPKFDGDYGKYYEFRSDFRFLFSSVQDDTVKRENLYVLKNCLGTGPRSWLEGEQDYDHAWKILDDRYGDVRKVSDTVINEISKIKLTDEHDPKMSDLYRAVKHAKVVLGQIKKSNDLDNSIMLGIIEKRMHATDRAKWAERQRRDKVDPCIDTLIEFMEDELWIRETANSDIRKSKSSAKIHVVAEVETDPKIISSAANVMNSGVADVRNNGTFQNPILPVLKCWYCTNSGHRVENCQQFISLSSTDRLAIVNDAHACIFCLKRHRQPCLAKRIKCPEKTSDGPCEYHHHYLLHGAPFKKSTPQHPIMTGTSSAEQPLPNRQQDNQTCLLSVESSKLLPVITSKVTNPATGKTKTGNVLLDSGSEISLIRNQFARKLELYGEPIDLILTVAGGQKKLVHSKIYKISVCGLNLNNTETHIDVFGIPRISNDVQAVDLSGLAREFKIDMSNINRSTGPIEILIGIDCVEFSKGVTITKGNYAYRETILGPVLFGSTPGRFQENQTNHIAIADVDLERFWKTEELGVAISDCCKTSRGNTNRKLMNQAEKTQLTKLRETARKTGNQWSFELPWKRNPMELPNNYSQARAKLLSMEKRLIKNPVAADTYDQQIKDLVHAGSARILTQDEIRSYDGPSFYVSHHAVYRPDKPSHPCRLVFNSAAPFEGHELNEYLDKCGDHLNGLLGVIIRWREQAVCIVGDVSKMYHQVLLTNPIDQNTHRFLWRNLELDREPDVYVKQVLTFGDISSPAIANTAMDMTAEKFVQHYPETSRVILCDRYMDDIATSVKSVADAENCIKEANTILADGHFKIKAWACNKILNAIENQKPEEKILGVKWQPQTNYLSTWIKKSESLSQQQPISKRTISSGMASAFDVVGVG